jgi:hypothetical protein
MTTCDPLPQRTKQKLATRKQGRGAHNDVNQFGNMAVRQRLEDFDFALQVIKQLCSKYIPSHNFYGDLVVSFLRVPRRRRVPERRSM